MIKEKEMNTKKRWYELLLLSMIIMVFLLTNDLFADWTFYYSSWEDETSDSVSYDPDHYYKEIDTDAWYSDDAYASGIDIGGYAKLPVRSF
jgi:hypothetical protein